MVAEVARDQSALSFVRNFAIKEGETVKDRGRAEVFFLLMRAVERLERMMPLPYHTNVVL